MLSMNRNRDHQAMHHLETRQIIPDSLEKTREFFPDPGKLSAITPPAWDSGSWPVEWGIQLKLPSISSISFFRLKKMRLFTVPIGRSSFSAISLYL